MRAPPMSEPAMRAIPAWLRPCTCLAVAAVHGAVLLATPWPASTDIVALQPLEVSVMVQGAPAAPTALAPEPTAEVKASEAVPETPPQEVAAADPHARETDANPPPPPLAEVTPQEAAPAHDETATVIARAADEPVATNPVEAKPAETKTKDSRPAEKPVDHERERAEERRHKVEEARKHKAEEARKRKAEEARQRQAERPRRTAALAATPAASPGHHGPGGTSSAMSAASYRSLVVAELNRRKRYPDSARSAGIQGTAVVTFTIGASGRVTAHSITQSSGNGALDNAVHQMMSALSLPPPPGGSFRGSAPIRFSIR